MAQSFWKTAQQFLTKLNIVLLYNPAITHLNVYPNELKTYVHTQICIQIFMEFYSVFIHDVIRPKTEGNQDVLGQVKGKQTMVHPYNGIIIQQ